MKVVIQRTTKSSVIINKKREEKINNGLMLLVGMTYNDNEDDIDYIVKKVLNLRIFSDKNNKMNLSIKDIKGDILIVSQFTLYASVIKGNRPSFNNVLKYDDALVLYNKLVNAFKESNLNIKTGEFGANMELNIINDGPVTILIDSKER